MACPCLRRGEHEGKPTAQMLVSSSPPGELGCCAGTQAPVPTGSGYKSGRHGLFPEVSPLGNSKRTSGPNTRLMPPTMPKSAWGKGKLSQRPSLWVSLGTKAKSQEATRSETRKPLGWEGEDGVLGGWPLIGGQKSSPLFLPLIYLKDATQESQCVSARGQPGSFGLSL